MDLDHQRPPVRRRRGGPQPAPQAGRRRRVPRWRRSAGSPRTPQVRGLNPRSSNGSASGGAPARVSPDRQTHRYELIPPESDEPGKSLAALPEPGPLDVFFDIEADRGPSTTGSSTSSAGQREDRTASPSTRAVGARPGQGKAMLEAFVDLVMDRLAATPEMHVYHYGGYESGALKRLMQRHAIREDEIDVLLRGRVLVNLYDHVVRQAMRASVESYSIEKLETFYMPEREGGITAAGFSVVEYERWMERADQDHPGRHRRLQPRRLHLEPPAPRLARGTPHRGGAAPRADWSAAPARWTRRRRTSSRSRRRPGPARAAPPRRARRPRRADGRAAGPLAACVAARLASARSESRNGGAASPARGLTRAHRGWLRAGRSGVRRSGRDEIKRSVVRRYRFDPAQEPKLPGRSPWTPTPIRGAGEVVRSTLQGGSTSNSSVGPPHPRSPHPGTPVRPPGDEGSRWVGPAVGLRDGFRRGAGFQAASRL